jgi:hypothetical protein
MKTNSGEHVKIGDQVRVKKLANVDNSHRNRLGTVVEDSEPGEVVLVEFEDEAVCHQFLEDDLDKL